MKGNATSRAQRIAVERADALFEQRRIDDIRTIEKATLHQIDEKRTKLRELVGDSYKDVIHSADAILEMSKHATSIVHDLRSIQDTLKRPVPETSAGRRGGVEEVDGELYAVGSRVKYVMDTQEVIWSALDAGDYVEAARRWLRAEQVHDLLMRRGQSAVMRRFPFVEHLWPSISQLKPQILERVRQSIVGMTQMSEYDVQWCLVAMMTLRMGTSSELLQTYLQFKKLSVLHLSTSYTVDKSPAESLCQIGTLLQETIVHVMHLFLTEGASEAQIRKSLGMDTLGYGGFLFGKLDHVSEQEQWDTYLHNQQKQFEELTVKSVNAIVEEWLKEVAQIVQDAGTGLLLHCTQLKSLSQLERSVKGTLKKPEWQSEVQEQLGLEIDLWTTVFESVVQQKCLSIVKDAFYGISAELKTRLQSLSEKFLKSDLEPLGHVSTSSWTLHAQKLQKTPQKHLRAEAVQIVTHFDGHLVEILDEVSEVLGMKEAPENEGDHSPTASTKQGSVRSFSLLSGTHHRGILPRKTHRSIELEPQIQSLWESAAFHLAQDLEKHIADLPEIMDLQVIETALLVGTTAMGLAENCPSMGLLAGPAEDWRPEAIPRSARSRSSVRPDPVAPPHLSNAFRHVAFLGVHLWIEWALEQLLGPWIEELQFGNLTGEEHLQEIVISHQAAEAADDPQMKFSIPSVPSEETMQLLMNTSQELQRLGFYSTQRQIIHSFQFRMEGKVRECLQKMVLGAAAEKLSDNYVLQILLDFRFLRDVLSSGAPVPKSELECSGTIPRSLSAVPEDAISLHDSTQKMDPAVKRAVAESQNQSKALEGEISSLLDPIDWATYEPHLWTAEQRCYRRTQILFGMIGTTNHALHADVPVKLPMGSATNVLQAASVAPRFQYLPVRPTAWTGKGLHSNTGIDVMALTEQEEDPTNSYSFSELGQTAQTSERTLQKTEMGSFTSLGTMFTDKAAEMSALAQQRIGQFGDYLQPSSLASSSIFSSFAKRVGPTSDPPL